MNLVDASFVFQIGGIAAALTLLFGMPAVWLARRFSMIDWPGRAKHKKHERPVPLAGGILITIGILALSPFIGLWQNSTSLSVLVGALVVMLFGAWDDRHGLPPRIKLVGQIIAALIVMVSGLSVHFMARLAPFGLSAAWLVWVDRLITLIWVVGITNAFNLIDSMDGLAIGTTGVALSFFLLASFDAQQVLLVRLSTLLLGICAGIYVYNVTPAIFFLGDSGAQMLGFLMACLGVLYNPPDYPQASSWFIPILILGVPIFDTTLVVFSRLRRHKPIYEAELSHTYHRLVAWGLDPRRAIALMHLTGALLGCLAFVALVLPSWAANLVFGLVLLVGVLLIIVFEKVKVYPDSLPK